MVFTSAIGVVRCSTFAWNLRFLLSSRPAFAFCTQDREVRTDRSVADDGTAVASTRAGGAVARGRVPGRGMCLWGGIGLESLYCNIGINNIIKSTTPSDRDRNRSCRRYHSRSRSRDRTGGGGGVYNRGGSPDKYDDMLYDEDDYHHQHDNRTRYHNNHGNSDRYYEQRSGGGGGDRDDRQSNYRQSYRSNDRSHHRGGGGSDERRRSDYDGGSRFDRRRRDRSDDSFLDDLQSNYSFDG